MSHAERYLFFKQLVEKHLNVSELKPTARQGTGQSSWKDVVVLHHLDFLVDLIMS